MLYKGAPPFSMSALYIIMNFNPRAPCGARPHWMTFVAAAALFQSTRPVWGATVSQGPFFAEDIVSIHAPRVGRDVQPVTSRIITPSFNPRAPCGARHVLLFSVGFYLSFNPRAPCGARRAAVMPTLSGMGFNPRAPCGARLTEGKIDGGAGGVSIHAPRVGRDGGHDAHKDVVSCFNPRAPCGARLIPTGVSYSTDGFNPRAPCGARRQKRSRLPSSATYLCVFPSTNTIFSAPKTHAPPAA